MTHWLACGSRNLQDIDLGLLANLTRLGKEFALDMETWQRAGANSLKTKQLEERLDRTLRRTNEQLTAAGFQLRNGCKYLQLSTTDYNWSVARSLCSHEKQRLQVLWNPAVQSWLYR